MTTYEETYANRIRALFDEATRFCGANAARRLAMEELGIESIADDRRQLVDANLAISAKCDKLRVALGNARSGRETVASVAYGEGIYAAADLIAGMSRRACIHVDGDGDVIPLIDQREAERAIRALAKSEVPHV